MAVLFIFLIVQQTRDVQFSRICYLINSILFLCFLILVMLKLDLLNKKTSFLEMES